MVSSFTKEIIDAMQICLKDKREFMLCTLLNRKNISAGGLQAYRPSESVDGINISFTHLTKEIVEQAHSLGKTVGVWIERKDDKENDHMYTSVLNFKIDFLYADHPMQAMAFRDNQDKK